MATELDAAKMEEEFRRQQFRLAARLRNSAFSRTTWILAFVGVLLICLTLFKIPNVDGGLPLPLNHEFLISFAVFSVIGISLNLFVFLMHLLACINERKLNKTQPPSLELIGKCSHSQKKLIGAIQITEACIFILGSSFRVYVVLVAVSGTLIPYKDANTYTGSCFRLIETSNYICFLFMMLFDGFPRHWVLD